MSARWWFVALLCLGCGSDPAAGGGSGGAGGAGGSGAAGGAAGSGGGAGADAAPPRVTELASLPPTLAGLAFAEDAVGNPSLWVVASGGAEIRKVTPDGATGAGFTVEGAGPLIALGDGSLLVGRAVGGVGALTQLRMDTTTQADFAPALTTLVGPTALAAGPAGTVAVADGNGAVYLLSGGAASVITAAVASPSALAWSADARSMYVGSADGGVFSVARDPGTGAWAQPTPVVDTAPGLLGIVVLPSGALVLTTRGGGVARWAPGEAAPTTLAGNDQLQFPAAAAPGGPGFEAEGVYVSEFDRGRVSRVWVEETPLPLPRE